MHTTRIHSCQRGYLGWLLAAVGALGMVPPARPVAAQVGQPFTPACAVPFATIETHPAIDKDCGSKGDAPAKPPGHQAQNEAKNNLCATGAPATVTFAGLAKLQHDADGKLKPYDRTHLPADRATLRGLGLREGSVARIVAFVASATPSNIKPRADGSVGESVNCGRPDAVNNDIHVVLMETPGTFQGDQLCPSVTAEVIPHLRPAAWSPAALAGAGRPVRITGQLFFDASHHPCKGGAATDGPPRVSEWEIHPVYKIEVCKKTTLAACPAGDDKVWSPL